MNIDFASVLAVALVHLVGVVSPGPNFVATVHRAVTARRSEALALVAGIASVAVVFALAAMLGVGLLLTAFPQLALGMKLAGAAYLIWFGIRLWRRADLAPAAIVPVDSSASHARAWRDGVLTNLANVKSIAFFASVFSAAVPVGASSATMAAMLVAVFLNALLWYGGVALLLSTARASAAYRRAKRWIDRACGALLVLFGARLIVLR